MISDGPVECLGRHFPNDEARRDVLPGEADGRSSRDPVFRKIEGFPIGELMRTS